MNELKTYNQVAGPITLTKTLVALFKFTYLVYCCRSIPQEQLDEINSVLERDFMIRAIHDVKGIDIGSNLIRYKV